MDGRLSSGELAGVVSESTKQLIFTGTQTSPSFGVLGVIIHLGPEGPPHFYCYLVHFGDFGHPLGMPTGSMVS